MSRILRRASRIGKKECYFEVQIQVEQLKISGTGSREYVKVFLSRSAKSTATSEQRIANEQVAWAQPLRLACTLYMEKAGSFQPKHFELKARVSRRGGAP